MAATGIEWASDVWNPSTGCDRVSPGCDHCYALTMAKRLKGMGSAKYQRDGDPRTSGPGFGITEHPDVLDAPLRWRKPRRVFVNSMSDLFHDGVSDEFIAQVWCVMALTPQHTYQILTKRHARMRSLLTSGERWTSLLVDAFDIVTDTLEAPVRPDHWMRTKDWVYGWERLVDEPRDPLGHVWLGVSVENQLWADRRIPALLDTPAAVRFLSCEPLLGPVDLVQTVAGCRGTTHLGRAGIGWVICGGESGAGARPMHPDWARQLRDQTTAAGVPFFFKQNGEWAPSGALGLGTNDPKRSLIVGPPRGEHGVGEEIVRVGKKAAGRFLDGRTWDDYPTPAVRP